MLSPSQRAAATHGTGPCEVIAGPGSGKTTVLVSRIRHLAENCGADPAGILVLTFTRAAADVMRRRSAGSYSGAGQVTFSTFHALFLQILRGSHIPYRIIEPTMRLRFLKMKAEDYYPDISLRPDAEDLSAWITGRLSRRSIQDEACTDVETEPLFCRILQDYQAYLREQGLLDLDEAASFCSRMLREDPVKRQQWCGRWKYIMVDEFQDINRTQYDLVCMLVGREGNLYVVGDDDQSIYGFRGSSPAFMVRFLKDHPSAVRYYLTENYRSSPGIVAVSAALIGENRLRIPKYLHTAGRERAELRQVLRSGTDVRLIGAPDSHAQTACVIDALREAIREGSFHSAALITRTHRQLRAWMHDLEEAGIPCRSPVGPDHGAERLRAEVLEDMLAYARTAGEIEAGVPRAQVLRILNRPDRGLGRDLLPGPVCSASSLVGNCRGRAATRRSVKAFLRDLDTLRSLPPVYFVRYLCGPCGYMQDRIRREPACEQALRCLVQELIEEAGRSPEQSSVRFLQQALGSAGKTEDPAQDTREDAFLELCTMHACKGREFDLVFAPDLNEGSIPSRRSLDPDSLEEERRLLYVTATRAAKRLYLIYVEGTSRNRRAPSRFLAPLGVSTAVRNGDHARHGPLYMV